MNINTDTLKKYLLPNLPYLLCVLVSLIWARRSVLLPVRMLRQNF